MRVVCILDEVMRNEGVTDSELASRLDIDLRTLRKVREDREPWRIPRETFYKLTLYVHEHGYDSLFEVRPHPIWKSFEGQPVTVFRGSDSSWDPESELHLTKFMKSKLHCKLETKLSVDSVEEIEQTMRTKNCVVLGSPKKNPAAEIALTQLWGAEPFNAQPDNRQQIPIQFLGMKSSEKARPESSLLVHSEYRGFELETDKGAERKRVLVSWKPPEEYGSWRGKGRDAALLVACRQPLQAEEDVTTVVISGYTGRATHVAVQEATHHQELPITDSDLEPGKPNFAVLSYEFKKLAKGRRLNISGLRKVVDGTVVWGPPWPGVVGRPVIGD